MLCGANLFSPIFTGASLNLQGFMESLQWIFFIFQAAAIIFQR